jgi:hypothetical protein
MKNVLANLIKGLFILLTLTLTNTATAWETTGLTDNTIKVGVMGPFTGNASSYSKTQIGLMAYFKHINDQGGIHGRKFEMFPEDTACAPAKGIAAAKKTSSSRRSILLARKLVQCRRHGSEANSISHRNSMDYCSCCESKNNYAGK